MDRGMERQRRRVSNTLMDGVCFSCAKRSCSRAANRLTSISFPDPQDNVTYGYDTCANGKGRICLMVDPSGTTSYEYTLKGQPAKESKVIAGQTYTTGYAYDKNGNPTTLKYPSGRVVSYRYANDRVTQVLSNGVPVASNITYKPFGGMTALTYGNGIQRTVSYDQQYRMASITDAGIQNLAYSYDPNGNITAIADQLDPTKSKSYGYDPLDRLSSAQGPWGSLAYTYDGVGNRLKESNEEETLYSYQANRLMSTTGQKPYAFTYDANGNTTAENVKGYIYNQNQRLIKVTEQSGEQTLTSGEYVYNGNGQRVKKTTAGQSTLFFYDTEGRLIGETGTTSVDYLFCNGKPIAKSEGSSIYYYHTDHLGTPQRMTDADKIVVWDGEFKPFGEIVDITGTIVNNLRFPGQYFDAETGLNYNYFRDYNPKMGRYLQADPIGFGGGVSLYTYVKNNPINWIDPSGLATQSCYRPLRIFPFAVLEYPRGSRLENTVVGHEHIFFDDGTDIGYGGKGIYSGENKNEYSKCEDIDASKDEITNVIDKIKNNFTADYYKIYPNVYGGNNCQDFVDSIRKGL